MPSPKVRGPSRPTGGGGGEGGIGGCRLVKPDGAAQRREGRGQCDMARSRMDDMHEMRVMLLAPTACTAPCPRPLLYISQQSAVCRLPHNSRASYTLL